MSYDRALTVFSPDGRLFQIDYALEAVARGTCVVGVKTPTAVILAAERRALQSLQTPRTVRKLLPVDDHIIAAFSGLAADARVLVNRARLESQSHRLTVEDAPTVEHVARYVAGIQQKYTQRGGARPFGVSMLLAGIDPHDQQPRLWMTDPAGLYTEWRAAAVGRSHKVVQTYLEKHWKEAMSREEGVKLALRALLEVVQLGAGYVEVVTVEPSATLDKAMVNRMSLEDVMAMMQSVEQEKAEQAQRQKQLAGLVDPSDA